ncbi:MAG: hypothetical protein AB8B88_03545 [Devosiaceae bacterium]
MFYLVLHTALLILAAFILGAIIGCLLKRFFSGGSVYGAEARSTPAQTAAAAATATVAARVAADDDVDARAEVAAKQAEDARKARAEAAAVAKAAKEKEAQDKAAADAAAVAAAVPEQMDESEAAAALAALPADASNEDKANAVGARPEGLSAPMGGTKDNLQRIKGIGKVNEGKLNELGIYHFSQVRDWTAPEARWVGTYLAFAGRIEREDWKGQARVLADGGETEFAKRVDKGEVESSSNKK